LVCRILEVSSRSDIDSCIDRSPFMLGLHSWIMSHETNTKFSFPTVYFLGIRGLTALSYIVYDNNTHGHTGQSIVYLLYIQCLGISLQYIYLFLMHCKYRRPTSIVFGTVPFDGTMVVLLPNTLVPDSFFCNYISIITNCTMLLWLNLTLWHMLIICSPFSSWLNTSNLSSVLIVFCRFFTCVALDDVDFIIIIIIIMFLKG